MKIPVPPASENGWGWLRLVAPFCATLCRYPASWSSGTGCCATLTSMCSLSDVPLATISIITCPPALTDDTADWSPVESVQPTGTVVEKRVLMKVCDDGVGESWGLADADGAGAA